MTVLIAIWIGWHLGRRGYRARWILAAAALLFVAAVPFTGVGSGAVLGLYALLALGPSWAVGCGARRLFGGGRKFSLAGPTITR